MILHTRAPGPRLARFVDFLWAQDGEAPAHARERILPSGTLEIVIALRDEPLRTFDADGRPAGVLRGAALCGPHARPFAIDTAAQGAVVGVHFKPGGAAAFLGPSPGELRDAIVPLDAVWGALARELHEAVVEARTAGARFDVLERVLLARLLASHEVHPAIAGALRAFQAVPQVRTVGEVTAASGLRPRRFIDLFRAQVGLTPKLFCRVRRLQAVLRRIDDPGGVRWAELALACGYFDQAHLVRDFRELAGSSPTAYLAARAAHPTHVALPD